MTEPRIPILLSVPGRDGVERLVTNLADGLVKAGCGVDLLVVGDAEALTTKVDGVRVTALKAQHNASAVRPLARYLRRERPPMLLVADDRVTRPAVVGRWLAGVPTRVVVDLAGTAPIASEPRTALRGWLQRARIRRLYGRTDGVIVPFEGIIAALSGLSGSGRPRIHAVPSPVITEQTFNLAGEPISHPWFQTHDRPIVLAAGELCARKDLTTLLQAFPRVCAELNARLVILGEGLQRGHLQGLASELGISAVVDIPGSVTNPYPYMRQADVFTLSSTWESIPWELIEALGLGVPVVSTDCPHGPREILADGRYGRLVPVGHPGALGEALVDTLISRPDPQTLRTGAEPYRAERSAQRYLEVLGLTG